MTVLPILGHADGIPHSASTGLTQRVSLGTCSSSLRELVTSTEYSDPKHSHFKSKVLFNLNRRNKA